MLLAEQMRIALGAESPFPILGTATISVALANGQHRIIAFNDLQPEPLRHESLPPLLAASGSYSAKRVVKERSAHRKNLRTGGRTRNLLRASPSIGLHPHTFIRVPVDVSTHACRPFPAAPVQFEGSI